MIAIRNQANQVIRYSLGETHNPLENSERWLASQIAPSSSTFIDVGANIGNWTQMFLSYTAAPCSGLLFEPACYAAEKLTRRFANRKGIEVIQAAVSDAVGQMSFYEEANGGETSSLIPEWSNTAAEKISVGVTTLDVEVGKRNIDYVDFLKIDAEGYDLHVLRGSSNLLLHMRIGLIQFEYGIPWPRAGSTLAQAQAYLEAFGYRIFLLKSNGLYHLNYNLYGEYFGYSNFVAVAPARISAAQELIRGHI